MKVFIILAGLLMLGACTGKPEGFVLKGELELRMIIGYF